MELELRFSTLEMKSLSLLASQSKTAATTDIYSKKQLNAYFLGYCFWTNLLNKFLHQNQVYKST